VFKIAKNSLAFENGHSDELSYQTCQLLLGSPKIFQGIEIIFATEAIFTQHCIFTLVGAHYKNISLNGIEIEQNKVYEANNKDILKFSILEQGFRLYLMASPYDQYRMGCFRKDFKDCFSPAKNKIRVIKGPEFNYLNNPSEFLDFPFMISSNSDLSGLRLERHGFLTNKIQATHYDITSSIVDDGVIQLTPDGPIVLLRERQVTGGYPRIFSVVKVDLDFLVQYRLGSMVHFELIELDEAKILLLQRERELKNLALNLEKSVNTPINSY